MISSTYAFLFLKSVELTIGSRHSKPNDGSEAKVDELHLDRNIAVLGNRVFA